MDPIFTTIINNRAPRVVTWCGTHRVWLDKITRVPYDVWSVANKGQREEIEGEVNLGNIELHLSILSSGSYIKIRFTPNTPVNKLPVEELEAAETVIKELEEALVKEEQPVEESATEEELKELPVESAVVEEAPEETVSTKTKPEGFDAAVAQKRWNDALAMLKDTYGDQVTFTTRAIMSLKDWDKIVEKYELV